MCGFKGRPDCGIDARHLPKPAVSIIESQSGEFFRIPKRDSHMVDSQIEALAINRNGKSPYDEYEEGSHIGKWRWMNLYLGVLNGYKIEKVTPVGRNPRGLSL